VGEIPLSVQIQIVNLVDTATGELAPPVEASS